MQYKYQDPLPVVIQCKPLNVITLGQAQIDNINRMITISDSSHN
jgi:hypothetical protein